MLRHMWHELQDIVRHGDPRSVALFLSSVQLIWSIVLASPWHVFKSSAYYTLMAAIAPEIIWAVGFFVSGLLQLYSTLAKGKYRAYCSLPSLFLFWFIALMLLNTSIYTPSPWCYLSVAVFSVWIYARLILLERANRKGRH